MRRITALLLAGVMIGALANFAAAGKAKTVWEDDKGDADMGQGLGTIPGGFDLVSGSIARVKKNLEFTATMADMPPSGSLPEGFRFLWSFAVDAEDFRLTVKSADIGKPDVGQGQTTERVGRVDLMGHFRLEGECGATSMGITFINCKPLAMLEGSFDPANASFTAIVPMKSVKAKTSSVIGPGGGDSTQICDSQICWVSHIAERSLSPTTVIDTAVQSGNYKVPRK